MTFPEVRTLALTLPNVVESTAYGTPAFKLRSGKLIARLREDKETLVLPTTFEERESMIADAPDTYYVTEHYLNYPLVLVRLARINPDALRDLMNRALKLATKSAKT